MNNYKKWTGAERAKSLRYHQVAIKMGLIQPPKKCRRCGQEKGIIQIHNHDYDVSLRVLPKLIDGTATEEEKAELDNAYEPLCWRCHMMLHSYYRNKEAVKHYFDRVRNGEQDSPVYRHNFAVLKDDYGV